MRIVVRISALGLMLAACSQPPGCAIPTGPVEPQDCASLSKASWTIFMYGSSIPLPVGHSRELSLNPHVDSECATSVASVTWSIENPGVAEVAAKGPAHRGNAWVTGVTPGQTAVTARIVFSDGMAQSAQPTSFRVNELEAPSPASSVVAEGSVDVDAPASGQQVSRFVSFTVRAAGNIDVTVDWVSPLNNVSVVLFQGVCSTVPCSGNLVASVRDPHVKPRVASNRVAAGDYSIRIDNLGPGAEACRYQVRLTP